MTRAECCILEDAIEGLVCVQTVCYFLWDANLRIWTLYVAGGFAKGLVSGATVRIKLL